MKSMNKRVISNKAVKNSLLMKNIVINLAIVIFLIFGVGLVSYVISSSEITSQIEKQIYLQLVGARDEINATRHGQEDQLVLLSDSTGIDELLAGGVSGNLSIQVATIIKNFDPYMENVLLLNKEGVVLFDSNNNELLGSDLSSRSYYQSSITGEIAHSEILVSKSTGHNVEVISVPIVRNDQVVGVMATSMNTEFISEVLDDIKIEASGYAFLLDEGGQIIYHPNKELVGINLADLQITELSNALPSMLNGEEGQIQYNYEKQDKMTMYIPIGNWTLLVNAVKAEYLSAVERMLMEIIVIGFVMLVIASGITALNTYLMVNKIKKVQGVLGEVTKGNLVVNVEETKLKKCWEVMECDKKECVAYNNVDLKCWEMSNTLCRGEVQSDAIAKIENCKECKTYKITEGDELGQMSRSLGIMVTTIRNLIHGIARISEQLSSSSQELSSSSEETTASAESISSRMEEMSSSAQNQTEYVEHINEMTHHMNSMLTDSVAKIEKMAQDTAMVSKNSKDGELKIGQTIVGMEEINKQTEKVVLVMEDLIKQSSEIGEINNIITFISEQTNLLSLNASIEAARAGEHGKGFGVVADEIGKLAQQSQKSAQAISVLIESIKSNIDSTYMLMNHENELVQNGIKSVNDSRTAFELISGAVYNLQSGMNEVVSYVETVKSSSTSVSGAIEKMSQIICESGADIEEITASTQEQTSVSEEISNAATDLARMAEELLLSVSAFEV